MVRKLNELSCCSGPDRNASGRKQSLVNDNQEYINCPNLDGGIH